MSLSLLKIDLAMGNMFYYPSVKYKMHSAAEQKCNWQWSFTHRRFLFQSREYLLFMNLM